MGPGGPAWPGGPFKPCSPWEKDAERNHLIYAPLPPILLILLSDLLQGQGFLSSLEDQASQGAPGHQRALFSLRDPLIQEPPDTDSKQGDHDKLWWLRSYYF